MPLGLDLYVPVQEDNPMTVEKIDLGRRFDGVTLEKTLRRQVLESAKLMPR